MSKKEQTEMTGEELAIYLNARLEHLQFIRDGAANLMARDQLGRDFFPRGETEFVNFACRADAIKDLLAAYYQVQTRTQPRAISDHKLRSKKNATRP